MQINNFFIQQLGNQPYKQTYDAMHHFTQSRTAKSLDEIWLVEHPPIFTLGKVGKSEHILRDIGIAIIKTDRGGQVTYHAPGQQIMYILVDLKRRQLGIREIVSYLENSVLATLADLGIQGRAKPDAPGIYIADKKIASLGLHIQKGCTLHGVALNVDMDLSPFNAINPCGYQGLQMTQVSDFIPPESIHFDQIRQQLVNHFINQFVA